MQPILITRMKMLIAMSCNCKLHFSLSTLQLALVAEIYPRRIFHYAAVDYATRDFMQSQTEGGQYPPSSLKDCGLSRLSRLPQTRATTDGDDGTSRFVPLAVCPVFVPFVLCTYFA